MLIEIVSDLICPWCLIGKRRLDRALAQRPAIEAEIVWHPFQLNPNMPREGIDREVYVAAKFGSRERAAQIYARVSEAAAKDGIPVAFDEIGLEQRFRDRRSSPVARGVADEAMAVQRARRALDLVEGNQDAVLRRCLAHACIDLR